MCFQKFITFLCGCTRIDEGECYLAAQLDVNFWRKIDCADYSIEHAEQKVQCGAGMFYCGATSEGQFFDKIEKGHQQVKGKLFAVVAELDMRKRVLLSKRDVWLAQGASYAYILALSEVKVLNSSLIIVDQHKKQYEHECNTWMKVKSLAKRHYDDEQVRKQQGDPRGPSFKDFLANFHPQVLAKVNESGDPSEFIDGQDLESVCQFPLGPQIPSGPLHQASLLVPSGPPKQQMPRAPVQSASAILRTHPTAQTMQQMRAQAQQSAVQNAIPEVRAHQQKLTRAKKQKVEPASSPAKSSSVVRRSGRVKDKKVNYRVDDNSDLSGSFSPVKAKSDSSGFSPGKSDSVHSPDKARTVGRKGSGLLHEHLISERKVSLADKIGDWRRHDSGMFLPNSASGDGAPQAMRGMKRQAEDEAIASPGGTRFKRQSGSDQNMNKRGAIGDGMLPLQSQQMHASFNPMMMPEFHATPLIKREFSDTADPVKRFNAFSKPTTYSQGGPAAGSTTAPAQNAMPAAPMWFNPLAGKMPDQASIPMASFAQASPASVHDFALPHNSAIMPEEASVPYERDADEKQVVDFGLPFDAGSNMADNIYSDIDWSLLGEGDFSLPA